MSQHGCPERLSNRSKGFQEDGSNQPTMEVLVETLTGTAFEMTVSPSDTIFAIKSKIFRVEGIPVSQQHLLYNLKELDDASSLCELSIADGARLRLVLGMRGGPISTRRLPPPAPANSEPWPDIERLLDSNRDDIEWTSNGCKVTVLVFRDGERVNMLRVRENHDGSYSPLETKYSGSGAERPGAEGAGGAGVLHENAVTMGKMLELRNRMEALTLQRTGSRVEIQKTRSEETLPGSLRAEAAPYVARGAFAPCLDNNYTRCGRGPRAPAGALHGARRTREDEDGAILEECLGDMRASPPRDFGALAAAPLHAALLSSSAADLDTLRRHSRILPALSRARVRSHLHLSDEGLHLTRREPLTAPPVSLAGPPVSLTGSPGTIAGPPDPPPPPAAEHKEKKIRVRCSWCRKRLSVAAVHECRCGASFCAPHRYAEVHGCAYDYKRQPRLQPRLQAPKLPKI